MYAICRTEGCANAGVEILVPDEVWMFDENGEATGKRPIVPGDVQCGVCAQPIGDLRASSTDTEGVLP